MRMILRKGIPCFPVADWNFKDADDLGEIPRMLDDMPFSETGFDGGR